MHLQSSTLSYPFTVLLRSIMNSLLHVVSQRILAAEGCILQHAFLLDRRINRDLRSRTAFRIYGRKRAGVPATVNFLPPARLIITSSRDDP